ncbi:MAG TPA: tetratricopeptide repeat protein [Anaerolineae bacterium]
MDANALRDEATRLYKAGQLDESVAAFEQVRAGYAAEGKEALAASVANDLGVVYFLNGKPEQARGALSEALAAFEKLGDVTGQAKAIGNLAQLMSRSGDKEGAVKNYTRAAELFHQVGEAGMEHDTFRALSQMQLQRGRVLEALAAYDQALAAKGGSRFLRAFLQIPLKLVGLRK